ncbi:hypothetical protein H4219_006174 [Mycoemilia scoparia]|uniref:MAPEG family protein n=1 Tax=Mycoemilia scoparia TaxID=417184 RepID=A0A9W8DJG3_9FUNG|nr:hypothetical protein H4219_006174 [Mycoemilia scoparia]
MSETTPILNASNNTQDAAVGSSSQRRGGGGGGSIFSRLSPLFNLGGAVVTIIVGGALLYCYILPKPHKYSSQSKGVVCALQLLSFSTLFLAFAIQWVGLRRFNNPSDSNPGTPGYNPSETIKFRNQLLQNTLEQFVVHVLAVLSLSAVVADYRLVFCLVLAFVLGRIIYYITYSIHPSKRAFGFAMTFFPSVFALLYVAGTVSWKIINHVI